MAQETTLNLDNIDLTQFERLDAPMTAEDVVAEQRKIGMNRVMPQAVTQNPEQIARARTLSQQTGIPQQAVQSNPEQVESQVKLQQMDLTGISQNYPVLSSLLSDLDSATVAQNDVNRLRSLEEILKPEQMSEPENSFIGNLPRGIADRATNLLGSLSNFVSQSASALEKEFPLGGFTNVGGFPMYLPPEQWALFQKAQGDTFAKAGEALKDMDFGYVPQATWEGVKESFAEEGVLSGLGETLLFGVEQGTVSIPDMVATVYGFAPYVMARSEEMGQERAEIKGIGGGTIRETLEAAPFAFGSAILERILPEKVFKGMSKTEVEEVGREIIEGATSKTREILARTGEGVLIEAGTEAIQEGIIEYIGERYGTDAEFVLAEMFDRGLAGAVGGGVAGGLMAGGIETVNVNRADIQQFFNRIATRKMDETQKEEARLQMQSMSEQRSIDGINEYSSESEMRRLDPEAFRQFVRDSDGDQDLQIFIDAAQAQLYLMSQRGNDDAALRLLREKASEASLVGNDVSVPIADFATDIAGTTHFDALRDAMTMSGETTAPFRQEQQQAETQNYLSTLMQEAESNASEYVEAQDIFTQVREQLIDSGQYNASQASALARVVPAWATVFAKRNGLTVKQAYESSGLVITGPQTGERARLEGELETFGQNRGVTRGYYEPANSAIRLTEAANLSTFLHEFAHFMYEMELGNQGNSPESANMVASIHNWYKRNADAVAKEAGEYEPNTTIIPKHVIEYLDNGTTGDAERDSGIRRAVHEQFARGFETYLMEGTAPSVELRNVFRTFARWLSQVYRAIKGDLNVNVDEQMRQVYDRLLATEDQLARAESRSQYAPLFTDATMAGMTEEEFATYQARQESYKEKSHETLRDKVIAQLTRQTKQWWKAELNGEIAAQTESLKSSGVYSVMDELKNGAIKLDHATVKDMVGEDFTDKIGRTSRRIPTKMKGMTVKGAKGLHPDEAAAMFDYGSGDEMIQDILDAVPLAEKAEAQAEAAMIDRHGDILNDGSIGREADDAVINEERGRVILDELKQLAKSQRNAPKIDRQSLKAMAQTEIDKLSFRELSPEKYRKAEIRYAQQAAIAMREGDQQNALRAKTQQALNYFLYRAALDARNDIIKIVDRMSRFNKKSTREAIQKAGNGYMEQIDKILQRFEFRKSATIRGVDQRNESISTWANDRMENDGDQLVLTPAVLNELYVTHWKNVPYVELTGIDDSLKNMEHVARYSNKIRLLEEKVDFQTLVNQWTGHIDESSDTRFGTQRTDVAEGRNWGRWAMAQMTKIPFLARWLDGGEVAGLSHDILVQPFTDAYAEEVKLWAEVGQPVMDLIEGRSRQDIARHNRKYFIPEIKDEVNDGNLYGNQILAVALNTGNESNLRKMLLGEGWANPDDETTINIDNPKLQAILRRMTKSDWDLVQSIWDNMNELYPQLAEVHRRTTGLTPPKVEAAPVQTPYGEYRGGYYPVKYDPARSDKARDNEDRLDAQIDSMFGGNLSIQASVTASSTNERTGYYAPIRLNLDVVPNHFQETIHFITHHDAVRQVNKLIRNPAVKKAITAKLGPEEFAQLRPWLNDLAKDGREANTKVWYEDLIGRLRFGITLGTMGFKASTGLMQFLGLSNIAAEVGPKYTYRAARYILGKPSDMQKAWEFARDNSKILNDRMVSMDREIKNAMSRISKQINIQSGNKVRDIFFRFDNSQTLKMVQEASMKHIAYIQTFMVDLPTWYAAYMKEMDLSGDEAKAYRAADVTVENIQGSGVTKDLSQIMRTRNEFNRMMTMFMTFFSSLWNLNRDVVKGARSGLYSPTTVAAKLMFLIGIPVFLEMILRGELNEPEDEDERLEKFLTKTALYPVASVPFVRDIASGSIGEFGYNISPVASLIEQGTQSIPELIARPLTDEEITKGQVKGSSKFVMAALGIPASGQIWATGEHLYEVLEEGEKLTGRELLLGPDKEE